MKLRKKFGWGLRTARTRLEMTQEDFSLVSSRTYLSTMERGLKAPTIEKVEQIASVLGVHPVSLLALAYLSEPATHPDELCQRIRADIKLITGL